jgi:hypothetical protein
MGSAIDWKLNKSADLAIAGLLPEGENDLPQA